MPDRHDRATVVGVLDISSRLLRYFLAVAEELHFTHAAERLFIAQPALSKAIRRLERELGFPLFIRNRQGVALTVAGQAMVPAARAALAELAEGVRAARAAQRAGSRVLRVGYHSSIGSPLLKPIIDGFTRRCPGWRVELRLCDWTDPAGAVLDARCDIALLRLPLPGQDELETRTLRWDPRWVALAADHRLVARESVRLSDLAGETFVALPASSGPFRDFWLALDQVPRAPRIGIEVANAEDYFEAIAAGHGIAMLAETTTRVHRRPGIAYRLVTDASPSELVVAWRRGSTDRALTEFASACLEVVDA
ncbi:DNA-binding transcriptional LysR family regulator [Kutzneria viridogrisea]|uniref:DNA-binding transcriptional LysR family regulator n=1 Tax=Kutzneria viridogrisea TaxID=47990 RepID=A0ABR6BHU7_9PSEU|nr:DNA-binding transcriptional LysR family regulator [Kutzneria viridogrisea]